MSNAARKNRKRNGVKIERTPKNPTEWSERRSYSNRQVKSLVKTANLIAEKEAQEAPAQTSREWAADYVEKHPELIEGNCPTCGATGDQPCMTRAGKMAKRHAGRVSA